MIATTTAERSLLLFLETCLVDGSGLVVGVRMNDEDFKIAGAWARTGFLTLWGRRQAAFVLDDRSQYPRTHCVGFSEAAWAEAHAERRARAARTAKALDQVAPATVIQAVEPGSTPAPEARA